MKSTLEANTFASINFREIFAFREHKLRELYFIINFFWEKIK